MSRPGIPVLQGREDVKSRPTPTLPPELLAALAAIPRGRHLTGADRARAVTAVGEAYHDHGLSIEDLTRVCGRSFGGVRLLLGETGLPIRPAHRKAAS